jgi:hypothetical protein
VLGQARANARLTPEEESHLFAKLLTHWALRSSLNDTTPFAVRSRHEPGMTVR